MAGQVGGDHGVVAGQRLDHLAPALAGPGHAVDQQQDRARRRPPRRRPSDRGCVTDRSSPALGHLPRVFPRGRPSVSLGHRHSSSTPATGSATSTARSPSTRSSASRSGAGCRSATRRSTSSWACRARRRPRADLQPRRRLLRARHRLQPHRPLGRRPRGDPQRPRGEGIEPEKPPYRPGGRTEGPRICFVRDPDGYRIELIGQ